MSGTRGPSSPGQVDGGSASGRHVVHRRYTGTDAGRGEPSSTYRGGSAGDDKLATRMAELARELQRHRDVETMLAVVAHQALDVVPGAEDASISAVHGRRFVETLTATGAVCEVVDRAQYETGEGPCIDSLYNRETVRLSDMRHEQRWPRFTARALGSGVASMLAVQLWVEAEDLGALNLVSREPGAFTDESEHVALLFASHAAVAMRSAQTEEQLRTALVSREVIDQAKGILMRERHCTGDEAFAMLVAASTRSNRKLRDIAAALVEGVAGGH